MSQKYGNDSVWTFIEEGYDSTKWIEVYHQIQDGEIEVLAHARDAHNARKIVDALITTENVKGNPDNKLTKREIVFLQFVASYGSEPFTTRANNAILFNDRTRYEEIKREFASFY